MRKAKDLTGGKFGRLTVLKRVENYVSPHGRTKPRWLCECDCGNETVVISTNLMSGDVSSCGCFSTERRIETHTRHGLSKTRLHRIWAGALSRCLWKDKKAYPYYGGRGIMICDEWLGEHGFENFHKWAMENGYAEDLTLDRIDANGNYEPSNCRWATTKEQSVNKRNTIYIEKDGETKSLKEWSEITGIGYHCLVYRVKHGFATEEIFYTGNLRHREMSTHGY